MIIEVFVLIGLCIGIARKNTGVGHANLAHFVHFGVDRAVRRTFDDAHARIGKLNPDGAYLLDPIRRVARHHHRRLGQPVAFEDLHTGRFLEAAEQLHRQGGRAAEGAFHRADVCIHRPLHHR